VQRSSPTAATTPRTPAPSPSPTTPAPRTVAEAVSALQQLVAQGVADGDVSRHAADEIDQAIADLADAMRSEGED
jgi:hypothetical protein